jgi:hypothetical protein
MCTCSSALGTPSMNVELSYILRLPNSAASPNLRAAGRFQDRLEPPHVGYVDGALAFVEEHRRDPNPPSTRGLEQACFDCGRWEAAHWYCSGCFLPTGPDDWYPWGSDTARRQAARAAATQKGHTPPKRPRGRPCRSVAQSEPNEAKSRLLRVSTRSGAGLGAHLIGRTGSPAQRRRSLQVLGRAAQ